MDSASYTLTASRQTLLIPCNIPFDYSWVPFTFSVSTFSSGKNGIQFKSWAGLCRQEHLFITQETGVHNFGIFYMRRYITVQFHVIPKANVLPYRINKEIHWRNDFILKLFCDKNWKITYYFRFYFQIARKFIFRKYKN